MIKRLLFIIVFSITLNTLYADTIPGGHVSGTWYAANSPYYINGYIEIPGSDTLTIEPGVEVNFLGFYNLVVNGLLEAVGTETDSIHFSSATVWTGMWFDNAPDNSHLDYCSFSGVGGLLGSSIRCENYSDPIISHCRITGTAASVFPNIYVLSQSNPSISDCVILGGVNGIQWSSGASNPIISSCIISNCTQSAVLQDYGNLTMIDCTIIDNTSYNYSGAGIRSMDYGLTLINCTISNNYLRGAGGGIYCLRGSHTLINCTINGNESECAFAPLIGGGGVCFDDANGSLSYCTVYDNSADTDGGGITISGTGARTLTIDHCTIGWNDTDGAGSGMWLQGSPTTDVANSIISNNSGGYGLYNQGTLTVECTDFYGNESGAIVGNVPAGFGVLDRVNYNGDSCDCYYDIFMDPMYADTLNRDFHLTVGSPCIDAGDTAFAYDPDSTITDMGAYWYNQTGIGEYNDAKYTNKYDFLGATVFSGPLLLPEGKKCKVIDIMGKVVMPDKIKPGIYFIEVDGQITQKVIKVR